MVVFSKEHWRFLATGWGCPRCHARLTNLLNTVTPNFYAADGRKLSMLAGGSLRADTVECPKCGHRWKMYGASPAPDLPPSAIEVLEVVETHRSQEFFCEDPLCVIDNSKSSSQYTESFSHTKEWTKSCQLDFERARSGGAELTLGAKELSGLKLSSEEKLRRTYSVSQGLKETFTRGASYEVPAHKKVAIVIRWKTIWQNGFVHAKWNGTPLQIPFWVAVGIDFDTRRFDVD